MMLCIVAQGGCGRQSRHRTAHPPHSRCGISAATSQRAGRV